MKLKELVEWVEERTKQPVEIWIDEEYEPVLLKPDHMWIQTDYRGKKYLRICTDPEHDWKEGRDW